MSEVVLTGRARRDLERLDPPARRRVVEKLRAMQSEPLRNATKLTDTRLGTYRQRVGEWRIVFDLDADVVVVLRIGHRSDIYRG